MLPLFYQTHLQQHLTRAQFLVLGILLELLQSQRQVKLERTISICVSLPDYYRKSASQITKVLEFTSINDRSDLVSHYYLLVNYLLPSGSDFINVIDRTYGAVSTYSRSLGMGEKSYPFILVAVTKTPEAAM
jgi:hypothetical protein